MSQIKVADEDSLYHPLDPTRTRLSESVLGYLVVLYADMSSEEIENDVLEVLCPKPICVERVSQAICCSVDQKVVEYDTLLAEQKKEMRIHYLLGALMIALGVGFAIYFPKLVLQYINILGGFALRDALSIRARTLPKLVKKKKKVLLIRDISVTAKLVEE